MTQPPQGLPPSLLLAEPTALQTAQGWPSGARGHEEKQDRTRTRPQPENSCQLRSRCFSRPYARRLGARREGGRPQGQQGRRLQGDFHPTSEQEAGGAVTPPWFQRPSPGAGLSTRQVLQSQECGEPRTAASLYLSLPAPQQLQRKRPDPEVSRATSLRGTRGSRALESPPAPRAGPSRPRPSPPHPCRPHTPGHSLLPRQHLTHTPFMAQACMEACRGSVATSAPSSSGDPGPPSAVPQVTV